MFSGHDAVSEVFFEIKPNIYFGYFDHINIFFDNENIKKIRVTWPMFRLKKLHWMRCIVVFWSTWIKPNRVTPNQTKWRSKPSLMKRQDRYSFSISVLKMQVGIAKRNVSHYFLRLNDGLPALPVRAYGKTNEFVAYAHGGYWRKQLEPLSFPLFLHRFWPSALEIDADFTVVCKRCEFVFVLPRTWWGNSIILRHCRCSLHRY